MNELLDPFATLQGTSETTVADSREDGKSGGEGSGQIMSADVLQNKDQEVAKDNYSSEDDFGSAESYKPNVELVRKLRSRKVFEAHPVVVMQEHNVAAVQTIEEAKPEVELKLEAEEILPIVKTVAVQFVKPIIVAEKKPVIHVAAPAVVKKEMAIPVVKEIIETPVAEIIVKDNSAPVVEKIAPVISEKIIASPVAETETKFVAETVPEEKTISAAIVAAPEIGQEQKIVQEIVQTLEPVAIVIENIVAPEPTMETQIIVPEVEIMDVVAPVVEQIAFTPAVAEEKIETQPVDVVLQEIPVKAETVVIAQPIVEPVVTSENKVVVEAVIIPMPAPQIVVVNDVAPVAEMVSLEIAVELVEAPVIQLWPINKDQILEQDAVVEEVGFNFNAIPSEEILPETKLVAEYNVVAKTTTENLAKKTPTVKPFERSIEETQENLVSVSITETAKAVPQNIIKTMIIPEQPVKVVSEQLKAELQIPFLDNQIKVFYPANEVSVQHPEVDTHICVFTTVMEAQMAPPVPIPAYEPVAEIIPFAPRPVLKLAI